MSKGQAQQLDRLRALRVWPDRATPVAAPLKRLESDLSRLARQQGGALHAWASTCPPQWLGRTAVLRLSRGVLTIAADDAATRFELDRWLRAGGEREVVRACPTTIRKVKVVIEVLASPSAGRARGSESGASIRGNPRH